MGSADRIYIRQGEDVQGPFPVERVRAFIRAGKATSDMAYSRDGQHWVLGSEIPGFFDEVPPVVEPMRRSDRRDCSAGLCFLWV